MRGSNERQTSAAARRAKTHGLLVLVLLAGVPLPSATQLGANESEKLSPKGESLGCVVPSASRTREGCEPKTVVVEVDKQVAVSLKVPSPKGVYCAATYEVEYTQRDKTVSVESTITNSNCAASKGEYKLAVSVRDEHGEVKTLDFFESWQRKDDQPVKFKGDYSIGENVDVVRVRPVQLHCTCTDVPTE